MGKRVFLIVLDSFGIGYEPDAADYGDEGSNTLKTIFQSEYYHTPKTLDQHFLYKYVIKTPFWYYYVQVQYRRLSTSLSLLSQPKSAR